MNNNKIEHLNEVLTNNPIDQRDYSVKDTESFNDILNKNVFNSGFKKVNGNKLQNGSAAPNIRSSKKGKRN